MKLFAKNKMREVWNRRRELRDLDRDLEKDCGCGKTKEVRRADVRTK